MSKPRSEELWVGTCIEAALPGVSARANDDGSQVSMHDLNLLRDGAVFAACEITAAADGNAIELWNLLHSGERWSEPTLKGGWLLTLTPTCRVNRLKREAPALLATLEAESHDSEAWAALAELGVIDALRGATNYPGRVDTTIDRGAMLTGGLVPHHGDAIVTWLDKWITSPEQRHNLQKLHSAQTAEYHLAILFPAFSSAPFGAIDLLMRDDAPLPNAQPSLPAPLTHVWLLSTSNSGCVFHWDGARWGAFPKVLHPGRENHMAAGSLRSNRDIEP